MSRPSRLARTIELARGARLYPALIVHGATDELRRQAATEIARTLLCDAPAEQRPCGECHHCRRIKILTLAEKKELKDKKIEPSFHPDLAVLERDQDKTVTAVDSTRAFLRAAHSAPFEARGQVFVVAQAETLSGEAGDALLKQLEEPGLRTPRHFFLLAPSHFDLAVTLRSRSQPLYLGAAESPDQARVEALTAAVAAAVEQWQGSRNPIYLLDAAAHLAGAGDFDDPRASLPWTVAAAAVRAAAFAEGVAGSARRPLLALAVDLLEEAPSLRLRGIPAGRLIEGLVSRRLGG